jgi:hypothetical protein
MKTSVKSVFFPVDGSLDGYGRLGGRLEHAKSLVFTEGWTAGRLKTPGSLPLPLALALALALALNLAPASPSLIPTSLRPVPTHPDST